MLSSIEKSGNVAIVKRNFSWGEDLAQILDIVERHFDDFNGNGFYPHPQEEVLQRELLAIPTLRKLSEAISGGKVRGMAITDLGLNHLEEAQRNARPAGAEDLAAAQRIEDAGARVFLCPDAGESSRTEDDAAIREYRRAELLGRCVVIGAAMPDERRLRGRAR